MECPICMDDICGSVNCVTTECGHKYHTSCLMQSVAHNGFGCPYCRTVMATVPDDDNEEDDEDDEEDEEELYDDYALRGFRFFFNNINGQEHDQEDIQDEDAENDENRIPLPSTAFIVQNLIEQGVTVEHLVKALLSCQGHDDYEEEEFVRMDDEIFGKLRTIITNYEEPVEQPVVEHVIDDSAQPKIANNRVIHRMLIHV